jgi:hypothetical protein
MLALVIVRKNRDVKIRFYMEIGVEKFRYCLRVGTFGTEGAVRKHGGSRNSLCIEAKAQGDYADRKGTVQNGEKKQFVG